MWDGIGTKIKYGMTKKPKTKIKGEKEKIKTSQNIIKFSLGFLIELLLNY